MVCARNGRGGDQGNMIRDDDLFFDNDIQTDTKTMPHVRGVVHQLLVQVLLQTLVHILVPTLVLHFVFCTNIGVNVGSSVGSNVGSHVGPCLGLKRVANRGSTFGANDSHP